MEKLAVPQFFEASSHTLNPVRDLSWFQRVATEAKFTSLRNTGCYLPTARSRALKELTSRSIMRVIYAIALGTCISFRAAIAQNTRPVTNTVFVENDVLFGTDKHYTNGLRYERMVLRVDPVSDSTVWSDDTMQEPFREASPYWLYGPVKLIDRLSFLDIVGRLERGRYKLSKGMSFGQTLHTPGDISIPEPDSRSRPYAGYLFYGSRFSAQKPDVGHQYTAELQLGLIGPFSFGEAVQKRWHDQINSQEPMGWDSQLERTPIVNLILSHTRFTGVNTFTRLGAMGHMKVRAVTGNMTSFGGVEVGGRLGGGFFYRKRNLQPIAEGAGSTDAALTPFIESIKTEADTAEADSSSNQSESIRDDQTSVSAQQADPTGQLQSRYERPDFGWYLFARSELRVVAHNYLVTGADGGGIDHELLGGDVAVGFAARYDWVELAMQFIMRRHEIDGRDGWPHRFASIRLSILPK